VVTSSPSVISASRICRSASAQITLSRFIDPSCATGGGDYNEGTDYGWETYTTWDNCNSTTSCP
jgi:hypothetical protein